MAYTFLDNSLNTIGVLTNKGGQTNDYWGDSITHEIATSQDVLTSVSLSVDKPSVNIDTSGNQKTWNHVIQGLSFNIDGIGRQVNENDYLIYQEGTNGKYYLMAITQVDESAVQSGFHYKTVQGLNAAAYDLSRKTLRAKSFAQIPDNTQEKGTAQNILRYIFDGVNWDVRTIGSFGAVDYDIAEGTTAQAVLLDIIGMFEAEVDAYVQLNNWGKGANVFNKNGSIKRIFDFSTSLGKYRGETIRYNKNMVSITKTGARDSMYTKLYVNGNNITIADANKGADFIVDDVANRKYNKLGAVSTPVTYLEGIISNSAIENPTALLAWGKKQLAILNHPRYNYQISATNDDKVQLGDTVIIQDTHASDPIYLKSKVISKSVSLADPVNNSFIVGEFSPIVIGADNGLEDSDQIMQLVNQANQTAMNAQKKADANEKKIEDTRTDLEKTIDQRLQEGKDYSDSLDQKQKEAYDKFEAEINKGLEDAQKERDEISKKADDMLTQANDHAQSLYEDSVSIAKQEAQNAITTAGSEAQELVNTATATAHSEAQQVAQSANQALTDAKKDLGDDIQKNHADIVATQEELSSKVSQSDYDKKTKDLETKYAQVKQTADGVQTDVAKYKTDNDKKVSANTAQIKAVSDEVSSKVSSVDFDKKTGDMQTSINTISQKSDSLEIEISKLNDKVNADGQVNQLFNTEFTPDLEGWSASTSNITYVGLNKSATISGSNVLNISHSSTNLVWARYSQKVQDFIPGGKLSASVYARQTAGNWVFVIDSYNKDSVRTIVKQATITTTNTLLKLENLTIPTDTVDLYFSFWGQQAGTIAVSKPMLVFDDYVGTYVQGNYNNNEKVTANTLAIKATNEELATKIAKSDYDKNNQTLNNSISKVDQKADSYNVKLEQYQKSNDGKVNSNTQQISVMNGQINSKVAKTDYDKDRKTFNTQISDVNQKADGIKASVTDLTDIMNSMGQVNQLTNTEFMPDLEGWTMTSTDGKHNPYRSYLDKNVKATTVGFYTLNADTSKGNYFSQFYQSVPLGTAGNGYISLSWQSYLPEMADGMYGHIWIKFHDKDGNAVYNSTGSNPMGNWISKGQVNWQRQKMEKIEIPQTATEVTISFETREGIRAYLARPMMMFDDHAGDYVPGNYNNNARVTALEIDVNGIHGTVNDPKKGLSATWDLANQGQTLAVQAQKDAKTADGKAVAAQKDATTAVTTAKGTQTTVTSVQKDVKDVQSKQTQTANQLTTEIKDRQNGDTNTLTQAKDFTSSEINKSETGMKTAIQQSAEGVVAQVSHVNQLFNTQFEDLTGWNITQHGGTTKDTFYRSILDDNGRTAVGVNIPDNAGSDSNKHYAQFEQDIRMPGWKNNVKLSLSWRIQVRHMLNYAWLWVTFLNEDKSVMKRSDGSTANAGYNYGATGNNADGKWHDGKFENIAVPDGCVWIRVSFQAREGTNLYMTSPMATFTDKAQPYMPGGYHSTNTVLELFDDRFALGIKNNTGNIISGINGDSTGLSIVGKKITISGDTTFQGSNFMNGAVIKNASIASAKIQNLDVDKLTGKTTEFVKSSWNSAYGYVNIEYGQMSVMGNNGITYFGDGYIHISAMNIAKNPPVLEDIGSFGSNKNTAHTNVDYLAINLNLWNTGKGYGEYGGDGIAFNVSQSNGTYQSMLSWESTLSSGYLGWLKGWHFRDYATFSNNLFGPGKEQIGIGNINAVPALSIGDPLTGIAGNNGNLYFYTKNGYISLDDVINNKTRKATFKRTGFWK